MSEMSLLFLTLGLLSIICIAILIVGFIHSEVDAFNKHKKAKEDWAKVQRAREQFYEAQREILRDVQRDMMKSLKK